MTFEQGDADLAASWDALQLTQMQLLASAIELAAQEVDCIGRGDLETLREVVGAKRRLAERLAASATELKHLAADLTVATLSQSQREGCRQQQAVVIGLYEQLFEHERTAEQLLNRRRAQTDQRARMAASWTDRPASYCQTPPAELCGSRLDLSSSA